MSKQVHLRSGTQHISPHGRLALFGVRDENGQAVARIGYNTPETGRQKCELRIGEAHQIPGFGQVTLVATRPSGESVPRSQAVITIENES